MNESSTLEELDVLIAAKVPWVHRSVVPGKQPVAALDEVAVLARTFPALEKLFYVSISLPVVIAYACIASISSERGMETRLE